MDVTQLKLNDCDGARQELIEKKNKKKKQMNVLYILGGVILLLAGIWRIIIEVNIFLKGKQDRLGNDIKLLGVGIMCLMIGIYLVVKYI